jgi:hypothetical protein
VSISAVTASDNLNFDKSTVTDSNNDIKLDEINSQPTDSVNEDSIPETKKITTTQDNDYKCATVDSTDKINKSKSKMASDKNLNINTLKSQKNNFEDLSDEELAATPDENSNIDTKISQENTFEDLNDKKIASTIDTNSDIKLNDEKQVKSSIGTDIDAIIENLETKINDTLTKIKTITDSITPEKLSELNTTLTNLKNEIETTISEAKEKYKNSHYEQKVISLLEFFSKEINKGISEIQNDISNAKGNFDGSKAGLQNRLKRFVSDVNAGITLINDVKKAIEPLFKNNADTKQPSTSTTKPTTTTKTTTKTKTKTSLTLKNIKTLSKNSKKVVITVKLKINGKIAKNKKVTFIFKGKKYVRKTNNKGIATLTLNKAKIKKLLKKVKVGTKVIYQVKYGKISVKKLFKVKK